MSTMLGLSCAGRTMVRNKRDKMKSDFRGNLDSGYFIGRILLRFSIENTKLIDICAPSAHRKIAVVLTKNTEEADKYLRFQYFRSPLPKQFVCPYRRNKV